jgi:hypothetical protein
MKASSLVQASLAGDAPGYPLDGIRGPHLRAVFPEIRGIVDPEPALQGKMNRWRKPGLYSAQGQLQVLALSSGRGHDPGFLMDAALEKGRDDRGIFRTTGGHLERLLVSRKERTGPFPGPGPSLEACALGVALLDHDRPLDALFSWLEALHVDTWSAAVSCFVLCSLLPGEDTSSLSLLSEASLEMIRENQPLFFDRRFNPDEMLRRGENLHEMVRQIDRTGDLDESFALILEAAAREIDPGIKKVLPAHPLPALGFLLALRKFHLHEGISAIYRALQEGGPTVFTASMTGVYLALQGTDMDEITGNLANRRELMALIAGLTPGRWKEKELKSYIDSESGMTLKEDEERKSKLRNAREPEPGKKKSQARKKKEQIQRMTDHVVESWTKADKARWKKERKKLGKDKNI